MIINGIKNILEEFMFSGVVMLMVISAVINATILYTLFKLIKEFIGALI